MTSRLFTLKADSTLGCAYKLLLKKLPFRIVDILTPQVFSAENFIDESRLTFSVKMGFALNIETVKAAVYRNKSLVKAWENWTLHPP